jgi:hypothetical protein
MALAAAVLAVEVDMEQDALFGRCLPATLDVLSHLRLMAPLVRCSAPAVRSFLCSGEDICSLLNGPYQTPRIEPNDSAGFLPQMQAVQLGREYSPYLDLTTETCLKTWSTSPPML